MSFWLDSLGPIERRTALPGDRDADVAIVGGGYTGLWTAFYLARARPDLRIVVLEAEFCGFGASGRNGGWASGLFPVSEAALTRRFGADAAKAMHAALAGAVDEVGRAGIDCDYAKGGVISLIRTPGQLRRAPADRLDAARTRAICDATGVLGGVYSEHCAALHPGKLVRGLASAVEELGVTIHEGTRALSVTAGEVITDRGTVRAGTVVRALEGYTAELPGHRRDLAPVYSLMIATEPLPAAVWDRIGLRRRETFTDERRMIIYGQRTADDRLAFGGRGAPYHFGSRVRPEYDRVPAVFGKLRHTVQELFGIEVAVAARWGGPLGIPRDWMPSVGLRDGVAWAGGYVGDGVAATNLAGRTLTDLILGRESDLTRLPWVGHRSRRWEPEPLRWLGINGGLQGAALLDALDR
ncbi:glycine/D-amino acid oxidase-like deaminating enzyme [Actinoplanes octamycinicus]|uniref:Glycine/D-amino acid oxidase-like deaminating enzyme n=1 Tax=Actinoplanes octamycinicus TaxID=135948 RepID=A0A7W7GYM6_9ACTN|nr:FAD-binding oxidoreductase [Actinoplanes octamycinicus]MBB4740668.1 glycine/D-amino acid oxidase-like deaminating enzyme [Actinoplanes octamycinicus]GIE63574.1 FAD-dependent oxidoreductase [Actinoplanes octamycinicus]